VILEFLGLPGSGKSTLCEELQRWLADADGPNSKPANRVDRMGLNTVLGMIRYWRATLIAGRTLMSSPRSWNDKRLAVRWFLSTLGRYAAPRDRRMLVLDEGLLQRSFLLFMERDGFGSVDRVARYVSAIPLPDAVIMVDVDPAESLARLQRRSRPVPRRFRTMAGEDQLTAFTRGAELLDLVLATASARRGSSTVVIRVPSEDVDQARRHLASEMATKLGINVPQS
jgi:adenylate kinase